MTSAMASLPVFMDPRRIAAQLVQPLRDALRKITTAEPYRRPGKRTAALRHRVRSEASRRAWVTIRANKLREKMRKGKKNGVAQPKRARPGRTAS